MSSEAENDPPLPEIVANTKGEEVVFAAVSFLQLPIVKAAMRR
jgi:hypothetical protein